MFENMTYENILNDMLSRVSSDVDKREGSVIYDALAPAAFKLAEAYFMLGMFLDLVFGDTAVGEYLDRVVADSGLERKPATYAVRKIETTGAIDIGTRWGLNDTSYVITEEIAENEYKAQCEQLGTIGNIYTGQLRNIDNVAGITATLTDIIESGDNIETDDSLRERFYRQVRTSSTSGNVYDYMKWALEVPGCGDVKVFPLWDGPGTVKVLVVDDNMDIDITLPETVREYIEQVRPIGPEVTVASPTEKILDVSASLTLGEGAVIEDIQTEFERLVEEYFREATFRLYAISYAKIGSLLLSVPGVADYTGLTVDSGNVSITLQDDEMPVLGTVTLTEVS